MPVITIEGPVLTLEKKEKLVKEITELASEIMNIPKDVYVVFIKENPYENMGQGGILISEKIKNHWIIRENYSSYTLKFNIMLKKIILISFIVLVNIYTIKAQTKASSYKIANKIHLEGNEGCHQKKSSCLAMFC